MLILQLANMANIQRLSSNMSFAIAEGAYTVSIKKMNNKGQIKNIECNPSIKDSKTHWFGGDGSKVKSDTTSIVFHFDFNQIMYARNIFHNIKDTLKIMNIFFLNIFLVLFFNINYLLARMNKELL